MAFLTSTGALCLRSLLIVAALGPVAAPLMAQMRVQVHSFRREEPPYQVEGGRKISLSVEPDLPGVGHPDFLDTLGYEPNWTWTILDPPASGATLRPDPWDEGDPDAADFMAPTVSAVTTFHIEVKERDHPDTKVVVALQVYPSLTLSVAGADAVSGRPCELLAARGPVRLPAEFSVAGPGGGTLDRDAQGRTFWTPPPVELPTSLCLLVQDPLTHGVGDPRASLPGYRLGHFARVRTLQVLPAVRIQAKRQSTPCHNLVSGNTCTLTAERRDGAAAQWQWTVLGARGGQISAGPQGATTYTAPHTSVAYRVYLRATDLNHPADSALYPIDVMPRIPRLPDYYAEVVLPAAQGDGWMAPTPEMTLFAARGEPGAAADPSAPGFERVLLVEDDPAMGALSGTLLAQSGRTFGVYSKKGVQVQTLRFGERTDPITAMAVRPKGSLPDNPRQIVFAEYDQASRQGTIWAGNLDGTSTLLAGRADADELDSSSEDDEVDEDYIHPCDGQGTQAAIGRITGMAMSADGTVTFTELRTEKDQVLYEGLATDGLGVIRQLAPDGHVTLLAGALDSEVPLDQPATDGHGGAAVMAYPSQLVQDPVAGAFYFIDNTRLRRVTPEGAVTTLAAPAFAGSMQRLQVLGDQLLVNGDKNALWRLNLRTGAWRTLMGPSPLPLNQQYVRLGPLSGVSPLLPPLACAALAAPQAMTVNAQGTCIIADGPMLLKIDLSRFAGHANAGPAAGAAAMAVDADEEAKDDPPSPTLGVSTSAPPAKKQKVK